MDNKINQMVKSRRNILPFAIFLLLVSVLAVSLSLTDRPPVVVTISPTIGLPGSVLVVEGKNFGDSRSGSSVLLAGARPTSNTYVEWTDTRISVMIPDGIGSGLVRVRTRNGESNPQLFTNRELIPVVVSSQSRPGYPHLEAAEPTKSSIGSIVTLTGLNFGPIRGNGGVIFTAIAPGDEGDGGDRYTTASTLDFDYESWTEQSVRVRVPDGATSGTVRIVTDRGESNALFFEVVVLGGSKSIRSKKGYQITSSVSVDRIVADSGASIDLWVPGPVVSIAQRNVETELVPKALWTDDYGVSRYTLSSFGSEMAARIELGHWLDRYVVENRIDPSRINTSYDTERRLYRFYTSPDEFVPSDDENIIEAAHLAAENASNPYAIAQNVYKFLLATLNYDRKSQAKGIAEAFVESKGDAKDYALLFCAMLRSLGVPARPISGLLVYDRNRTVEHTWAEFYIEGYGWIPVDLALADGVVFGGTPAREDPEIYYFGNLDANRITFTRGVAAVVESELSGLRKEGIPSLQTIHERPKDGIGSYRSNWSRVEIIDFW